MKITIMLAVVFVAVLVAGKLWVADPPFESAAIAPPRDSFTADQSTEGGHLAQVIQKRIKGPLAPDIVSGVWLNSPPLASQDLRGKVVIVEFWTHG